ncbi:shikimate kinase [Nocardioides sp. NPDC101246]|uniref:shikimate kinase n=1 Tax=Nocardioides sp. NPDC101246 TaxID=3364336 RepID=UPI00380969C2
MRVSVVGSSGSGKSTVARRLADILGVPYIELDSIHWQPGWVEEEQDVFVERVREATRFVSGARATQ